MGSRWIPRIPSPFGGGSPPPPLLQDHQAPKYIVGNEPAGDTIIVCDFLDPGDGTGVAAAIAAAAVNPGDIWCRPGTYNFGAAGSPATPMTIPPNVLLRGASRTLTIFVGDDDAQQDLFVLGAAAAVEELRIVVPASAGAAAGAGIVQLSGEYSALRHAIIDMQDTPLTTVLAVSTGVAGACVANVVEDVDVYLPSIESTAGPTEPYTAIRFGNYATESPFQDGGPIARGVRVSGGQVGVVFINVAGGIAEDITAVEMVTSSAFSSVIGWILQIATVTPVVGCRIAGVLITSDTTESPANGMSGIGLANQTNNAGTTIVARGFEISDVKIRFNRGGNPAAERIGLAVVSGENSVGRGCLVGVKVVNLDVSGHTTGVLFRSQTPSAVASAGEVRDCQLSNVTAPVAAVSGAYIARGMQLVVGNAGIGDKIKRINITNCDFSLTPATGIGVDIGVQVNNTIVVANQLTPSGGTALSDLGTGTEIGHNIL